MASKDVVLIAIRPQFREVGALQYRERRWRQEQQTGDIYSQELRQKLVHAPKITLPTDEKRSKQSTMNCRCRAEARQNRGCRELHRFVEHVADSPHCVAESGMH